MVEEMIHLIENLEMFTVFECRKIIFALVNCRIEMLEVCGRRQRGKVILVIVHRFVAKVSLHKVFATFFVPGIWGAG